MQLRHPQLDVEIKGIGHEVGTKLAFSPASLFRLENGSAAWALIPMEAVKGDPSFDPVSHEFKVENGLSVLRVLKNFHRGTLRAMTRSRAFDGLVRRQSFSSRPLRPSQGALQICVGFYIDPLALVIPVGGIVDGVEFRKSEYVAFETIRVLPFHFSSVNNFAEPEVFCLRGHFAQSYEGLR